MSLFESLDEALWNQLPFVRAHLDEGADLDLVLEKYAATVAHLSAMHDASAFFLETVCRTNFEVRSQSGAVESLRREMFDREWIDMLAHVRLASLPADGFLNVSITNQEPAELVKRMRGELRNKLRFLIREFFDTCRRGVEKERLFR